MQKKVEDLQTTKIKDTKEGSVFSLDFTKHPGIFERSAADATWPPPSAPWIIRQCAAGVVELEKKPLKLNLLLFKAQLQKECVGLAADEQSELRCISKCHDRRKALLSAFGPPSEELLVDAQCSETVLAAGFGRGNIDMNWTHQLLAELSVATCEKCSQDIIVIHGAQICSWFQAKNETPTLPALEHFFTTMTQTKLDELRIFGVMCYTAALAHGDLLFVPPGCFVVRHTRSMVFTASITMLVKDTSYSKLVSKPV